MNKIYSIVMLFMIAPSVGSARNVCSQSDCIQQKVMVQNCHHSNSTTIKSNEIKRIINYASDHRCSHMGQCFLLGEMDYDPQLLTSKLIFEPATTHGLFFYTLLEAIFPEDQSKSDYFTNHDPPIIKVVPLFLEKSSLII